MTVLVACDFLHAFKPSDGQTNKLVSQSSQKPDSAGQTNKLVSQSSQKPFTPIHTHIIHCSLAHTQLAFQPSALTRTAIGYHKHFQTLEYSIQGRSSKARHIFLECQHLCVQVCSFDHEKTLDATDLAKKYSAARFATSVFLETHTHTHTDTQTQTQTRNHTDTQTQRHRHRHRETHRHRHRHIHRHRHRNRHRHRGTDTDIDIDIDIDIEIDADTVTSPFLLNLMIEVYKKDDAVPKQRVELYTKQV